MAIERDYEPVYAQAGDRVVIDVRGGSDETLAWDTKVAEACDNDHGYWYCDACRKSEQNNMGIQSHMQKGHTIVWMCFEHGPETVNPKTIAQ